MSGGQPVQTVFPCGDGPIDPRSNVPIGHFQGQRNIQVRNAAVESELVAEIDVSGAGDGERLRTLTLSERIRKRVLDATLREHLLAHPLVELRGGRKRRQRTRELSAKLVELLGPELDEGLLKAGPLPLEPRERAMLGGGGELVLAGEKGTALQPAPTPLDEVALESPAGDRGDAIKVDATPRDPTRITVDLRAAGDDPAGTVRVFDLAERDAGKALVGGTTFITIAPG
jgi:hypothetical protein